MSVQPYELLSMIEKTPFSHQPSDIIHLFLAGSSLHGARLPGKSDLDVVGIYIEPPVVALGVVGEKGHQFGTSPMHQKNKAGDEDAVLKTLREWARLAMSGNPTVLQALFTPPNLEDPAVGEEWRADGVVIPSGWSMIRANRSAFLASSHATAFLGYGKQQYERMRRPFVKPTRFQRFLQWFGELHGIAYFQPKKQSKGKARGQLRPELVEKFGYDTKMAMHLIRLMYEGIELVLTGAITYPRPEVDLLLDIRNGMYKREEVERMYLDLEKYLKGAEKRSPLPKKVDAERISVLVSTAYLTHWKKHLYL